MGDDIRVGGRMRLHVTSCWSPMGKGAGFTGGFNGVGLMGDDIRVGGRRRLHVTSCWSPRGKGVGSVNGIGG